MSVLISFLEIKKSCAKYCVVCLRTSSERRLEQPKYLKKFVESINLPFMYTSHQHQVCYICERQAAIAYKFRVATNLAASAHALVTEFRKCDNLRANFVLRYNSPEDEFDEPVILGPKLTDQLEQALRCEAQLTKMRTRTRFALTEMLIVSTTGGVTPDPTDKTKNTHEVLFRCDKPQPSTGMGESSGVYVMPEKLSRSKPLAGRSEELAGIEPTKEMEPVLIFDDDPLYNSQNVTTEAPSVLPIVSDPRSLNCVTPNDKTRVTPVAGSQPTNYLLHPIVMNSGVMMVPTLSAKICNGRLVTSDPPPLAKVIVATPKIALDGGNGLNFIIEPQKVTSVLKTMSPETPSKETLSQKTPSQKTPSQVLNPGPVDTSRKDVSCQVKCNSSVASNVTQSVRRDAKKVQSDATTGQTLVIDVTKGIGGDVTMVQSVRGDVTMVQSVRSDDAQTQGVTSDVTCNVARSAVLSTDSIDWEDKIPMDLISFMDSDKKASKRPRFEKVNVPATSAFGIISHVTSLRDRPPDEVIDLC